MTNGDLVRRYLEANARSDLDALESMPASDWEHRWPATGEIVRTNAAYRALRERYPGGYPSFDPVRVIGSEDWSEIAEPPAWRDSLTERLPHDGAAADR